MQLLFPNIENAIQHNTIYENRMLSKKFHYHIYFTFISHKTVLCMAERDGERDEEWAKAKKATLKKFSRAPPSSHFRVYYYRLYNSVHGFY